jgi:hypothetical protein
VSARFGPNSISAKRLLDDLDHLSPGAVVALAAAGGGTLVADEGEADVDARAELRARLREIARRGGRLDAVRAVGDEVASWASSTTHWFPAGVAGALDSTKEIGPRMAAVPTVLDAAYGVVLEDLLSDEELDLLLGPWSDVVGSPFDDGRRVSDGDTDDEGAPA